MTLLLTLVGVAFVVGVTLALIGWRGTPIDDHPLCRRCKYDLVGTDAIPKQCPECGSALAKPRRTRIGNRRRRRAMLTVGIVVSLLSLSIGGVLGWSQAKKFDWYPYKPLWMLQSEIEQDPSVRGGRKATAEIFRRFENDNLSNRQVRNIVDKAIALQTNPNANWNEFWGDFIEEAWLRGKTTDEKLKQYCQELFDQGISFRIATRAKPIEWTLYFFENVPCRGGSGKRFHAVVRSGPFLLDDDTFMEKKGEGVTAVTGGQGGGHSGSNLELPDLPGRHALTATHRYWVYPITRYEASETSDMTFFDKMDLRRSLAVFDWSREFSTPIEIVGPDDPTFDLVEDEALVDRIRSAARVHACTLPVYRDRLNPDCWIAFDPLPIAVSFDVYWRIDEREWLVEHVVSDKKGNSHRPGRRGSAKMEGFPLDAQAVDIVLRSNPEYASQLVAPEQVWVGTDIVIENQPLVIQRNDE